MGSKVIDVSTLIVLDTSALNKIIENYNGVGKDFYKILDECKDSILIPNTVYDEFYAISQEEMIEAKLKNIGKLKTDLNNYRDNFDKCIDDIDTKIKDLNGKIYSITENTSEASLNKSNQKQIIHEYKNNIDKYLDKIDLELLKNTYNKAYNGINNIICYSLKNKKNKTHFSTDEIIKICEEGKIRFENLLPPGFSDKNKRGYYKYNDLFIWKEILNYTKENKSIDSVIFITEDMKEGNWWKKTSANEKRKIHRFLLDEFNSTVSSNNVVGRKIEFMTVTDFIGNYNGIKDVLKLIEFDRDKIADEVFYVYRRDLEAAMFNQIYNINPIDIDEEFYRSDLPEFEAGDLRLLNNGIKVVDDTIRCRLSIGLNVDMNFEFTDKEGDKFELGEAEVFLSARAYIDLKYKTDCQKNRYEITYPDKIEETNFELKYVNMQVLNSKNLYDY